MTNDPANRISLVWLRRDLRLADNPALRAARERGEVVIPVYIWAPDEEAPWAPGAASRWWLHHSLCALRDQLRATGSPLIVRRGDSLAELRRLIQETGASAVHWNRLYEPAVIARDRKIKDALKDDGLEVHSHNAALMIEPWSVQTQSGDPYRVFSPFHRACQKLEPLREVVTGIRTLSGHDAALESLTIDELELLPTRDWADGFAQRWTPGESGAHAQLERFCDEAAAEYKDQRDRPGIAGTSRLSPHLHFGELSPVQAAARTRRLADESDAAGVHRQVEHFVRELYWREFAHHLLYHFPETTEQPLNPRFNNFPWRRSYKDDLRAWQRGATGIPIVDAGMRELWTTGWMHNRVRMIVASLLTKNLLIPWQDGAAWFWDTLVDADLANNTLGWQWTAGCGADAAPYFRVFNPVLQSKKFDGDGAYLKRWCPELKAHNGEALHAPWSAEPPPEHYPAPIIDLYASRDRALAAYDQVKS